MPNVSQRTLIKILNQADKNKNTMSTINPLVKNKWKTNPLAKTKKGGKRKNKTRKGKGKTRKH